MRNSSLACIAGLVLFAAQLAAQQTQAPATPPPQPPAGAANGPEPGPAVKTPGPGDRTGDMPQKKDDTQSLSEAGRAFLAIGAPPDPAAVKRGQATFVATCGFCHGSNAHGGNTGPDLVRSVLVLHDRGTAKEITPVLRNGRPGKGMPAFPNLTDEQIKDIAAFLLSRNQAAANRMDYKIQNIVTGDSKSGEAYFAAHCANCHSATGDLAHIAGKYEAVALQGRMLYPHTESFGPSTAPVDPREQKTVTVTLPSGQSYSGKLDHLDDFSVALTDVAGQHLSWLFEDTPGLHFEVHDPLAGHVELLTRYTNADMHNVLAYLETLK